MTGRMIRMAMLALTMSILAGSMAASMAAGLDGNGRNTLIREGRTADLEILNSVDSRERFQLDQQRLRETDRRMLQRREPLPEVQQFRPSCTVSGDRTIQTCR